LPPNNDGDPSFWIIAGPNGSGKSTAYSRTDVEGIAANFWIVNPDLLTARIQAAELLNLNSANLTAVERLERWLEATLRVHKSVGVETVLSTGKYQRLVELAKSLHFSFRLIYVMLDDPELNVARVRQRVSQGGHDVPPEKVVERYWRSLAQLPWFMEQADAADIYDNSGAQPRLVGHKAEGQLVVSPRAPVNLLNALGLNAS
jgi:predicted ABC-type ATPase